MTNKLFPALLLFTLLLAQTAAVPAQQLTIQERLARLERNAGSSQGIAELVTQIQQLQQELAQLRGQLEQQAYELESLKKRQKVLYMDVDSRLQALETGQQAARPESAPDNSPDENNQPATGAASPEVRAPVNAPVDTQGMTDNTPQPVQPSARDATAAALYEEAFAHLKAGRYTDSARLFEDFIQRYPDNELTDNAYYWLGESYYVTRNYELALDAFEQLKSRFPNSNKLADALLKIGYTQYELGLYPQAWQSLQTVVREFPGSAVARLAQTRLRKMQREGKGGQ